MRRLLPVALLVVAALLPGARADAAGWTITDLGTLGRTSGATKVAVAGDGTVFVAGWWGTGSGPERPFRWDTATRVMHDLPPYPGDTSATVVGVDPRGRVVGRSQQCPTGACTYRAVLWTVTAGAVETHELSAGEPMDLSPDGHTLVGFAGAGVERAGAVWTIPDAPPYATTPVLMPGGVQRVGAVNDAGVVLSSTVGGLPVSAVRLHPDSAGYRAEVLDRLPGHDQVLPYGISNSGIAAGATYSSVMPMRAVLWPAGGSAAVPLVTPPPTKRTTSSSYAFDVDDAGVAVGVIGGRATMWATPEQALDLTGLLPKSGWVLEYANAITRTGRYVVGQGELRIRDRAFLLSPS